LERTGIAFSGRTRRCKSIRAGCAPQLRVGCSRRAQRSRKDRHGNIGSSRPEQIEPDSMGCRSRSGPLASSSSRDDRRTALMARGRKKPGRPTGCSMQSAAQYRITTPDIQPVCDATHVRPLPAAALDWFRRNGRPVNPCGASPAGPANSRRDSPADRRSRPAPPRSRLFLLASDRHRVISWSARALYASPACPSRSHWRIAGPSLVIPIQTGRNRLGRENQTLRCRSCLLGNSNCRCLRSRAKINFTN